MTPMHRFAPYALWLALVGCTSADRYGDPADPNAAPAAFVDRFGPSAVLFNREDVLFNPAVMADLVPGPNEPIDMDALFLTHSLGPDGQPVTYYGLDIQSERPVDAYLVVDESGQPVAEQLPIVVGRPGDTGYSDFVNLHEVHVGNDYPANVLTSLSAIQEAVDQGTAAIVATDQVQNWALVPAGTTASRRFAGAPVAGTRAWLDGEVASLLVFEQDRVLTVGATVPLSNVIVIFEDGMSPAEGFATESDGVQTHNVVETVPGDPNYSSLWQHQVGARDGFDEVVDFATATANVTELLNIFVNCPVVTE
jgi:hypothetical protein